MKTLVNVEGGFTTNKVEQINKQHHLSWPSLIFSSSLNPLEIRVTLGHHDTPEQASTVVVADCIQPKIMQTKAQEYREVDKKPLEDDVESEFRFSQGIEWAMRISEYPSLFDSDSFSQLSNFYSEDGVSPVVEGSRYENLVLDYQMVY